MRHKIELLVGVFFMIAIIGQFKQDDLGLWWFDCQAGCEAFTPGELARRFDEIHLAQGHMSMVRSRANGEDLFTPLPRPEIGSGVVYISVADFEHWLQGEIDRPERAALGLPIGHMLIEAGI